MPVQDLAAAVISLLIGVVLGTLGSGGSITMLPVLVYVAGVDPRNAVAMSLTVVGATSVAGAWLHAREGNFHRKAATLFAAGGIPGAWIGSMFTRAVPAPVLMLLFAVLMLAIGIVMLAGGLRAGTTARCRPVRCAAAGFVVGLLTGFLGVGGGFLILPALVLFAGVDAKTAVGTSLAIIALNSAAGLAGQMRFARIDWIFTLVLLGASLGGMTLGIAVVRQLEASTLTRVFAVSLVLMGAAIGAVQVRSLWF